MCFGSVQCVFLCDLVLMTLGVLGLGKIINDSKPAITTLTLAGVLFLLWYGYNALKKRLAR
ncbi:hypothetical protein OS31_31480 [Dickeya oryzae]